MKKNDATYNRPEGERTIDAPYVVADIEDRVKQLKDENAWEKNDRNSITLFKTPGVTIVLTCLHNEAVITDITVDGIVVIQVIEGKVNVTTDGDAFELCEKKIVVLHPNVIHSIYALKTSVFLLTNYSAANS
jgi:quercetin dioxygenase-like cupin family protein